MTTTIKKYLMLMLALVALTPLWSLAETFGFRGRCQDCGCSNVRKVCKLVPDKKKVQVVKYTAECEDFCIQAPSELCGYRHVPDCEGGKCEKIWKPNCGCVWTRTKLVKKTTTEEKPGYKCVVETICVGCGCCCARAELKPDGTMVAIDASEPREAGEEIAEPGTFIRPVSAIAPLAETPATSPEPATATAAAKPRWKAFFFRSK